MDPRPGEDWEMVRKVNLADWCFVVYTADCPESLMRLWIRGISAVQRHQLFHNKNGKFYLIPPEYACLQGATECHTAPFIYANRAADLNENPLAGDQWYWSAWAPALSKVNWSITTGWLGLMEHDWYCPTAIMNTTKIPTSVWVKGHFSLLLMQIWYF